MINLFKRVIDLTPLSLQAIRLIKTIGFCFFCAALGWFLVLALHFGTGTRFMVLTRDPAATNNTPIYVGILSNLGVMLWAASAAVCIFSASVIKKRGSLSQLKNFFLFSGLFSLCLGIDDLLMMHENFFPNTLMIPEKIVYLCYLLITFSYLLFYVETILCSSYLLLYLALLFFSISVGMDKLLPFCEIETFFEDGFKFTGIIFWLTYYTHTALESLTKGEGNK